MTPPSIKSLNPVRVGKEPTFDPDWEATAELKNMPGATASAKRVEPLGQVLQAAVEYSRNSAKYANDALNQLISIVDQTRQLTLETKQHELASALQAVYLANDENVEACNQGWSEIIKKAQENEDFKSVAGETGIATYADNIIQPYRFAAARKTIARNNQALHDISVQQVKQKQNDLSIAFAAMAGDDLQGRENGFQLYANTVQSIAELVEKTNPSGEPVFNEHEKATIATGNVNVLAQGYVRARYAKLGNLADKLQFIHEIGNGTHTVDLKTFLNVPEVFIPKGATKDAFGEFRFADVLENTRLRLSNELSALYEKEIDNIQKAAKEKLARRTSSGEVPPNPRHAVYQQSVRSAYEQLTQPDGELAQIFRSTEPKKWQQMIKLHTDFVEKFRFVPLKMTDVISANMQSHDPAMIMAACTLTDTLISDFPHVVFEDDSFFDKGSAYVYGAKLFKNGTPPDIVADIVRGMLNVDERIKEVRRKEFDDKVKKGELTLLDIERSSFKDKDKGFILNFFSFTPEYPTFGGRNTEMKYEYRDLARGFYIRTGDLGSAKKTAIALLQQKWGMTEINGVKEIVPYAIEDFYCNKAFPRKKLKKRTLEHLNKIYSRYNLPAGTLKDIAVYPDATTMREIQNGSFPTYRIYFKSEYGAYENEHGRYDDTLYGDEIRLSLLDVWDEEDREASGIFDTATEINQSEALRYMANRNESIRYMQKQNKIYRNLQNRKNVEEMLSNKAEEKRP